MKTRLSRKAVEVSEDPTTTTREFTVIWREGEGGGKKQEWKEEGGGEGKKGE